MTQPDVTVVIPTRDRWALLPATLQSALAQEGVALEVVVIDDGSAQTIPKQLVDAAGARLRVIRHDSSRGVAAARNAGIAAARGSWIAFLDDDDLWAPHKLRTQLAAARQRGASWAYSAGLVVDPERSVVDELSAPDPDELMKSLLRYNAVPAGASNVVARTNVVRTIGAYDETLAQLADWDLWIRLADAAPAAACPEPLMAYVQHPGAMLLAGRRGLVEEFERLAAKHASLTAQHGVRPDRGGLIAWMAWADSRAGRRWRAAAGYLRASATYARRRVASGTRYNLGQAVGVVRGEIFTDTGRRRENTPGPEWLQAHP